MNIPETLYFPDTALLSRRQAPLFLLFSRVNIVQVVEGDERSEKLSADSYRDSGFCQALPLHPLKSDKDRFLYLINDIKNRKDDYAAQLSHITLASMSGNRSREDESERQILSSLLGRKTTAHDAAAAEREEILWQARLVLKIAEILDREEEEVAQALLFLEDSENDIFSSLKGEFGEVEENLYDDLNKLTAKLGTPRVKSIEKRLRSWFRFIDGADLPACPIWSTTRTEVADILFDNHEKKHNRPPEPIAHIDLPANPGPAGTDVIEATKHFHAACDAQLADFFDMVLDASTDITAGKRFSVFTEQWQSFLEAGFPVRAVGRTTVTFHRFSEPISSFTGDRTATGISSPTLLALFASR